MERQVLWTWNGSLQSLVTEHGQDAIPLAEKTSCLLRSLSGICKLSSLCVKWWLHATYSQGSYKGKAVFIAVLSWNTIIKFHDCLCPLVSACRCRAVSVKLVSCNMAEIDQQDIKIIPI